MSRIITISREFGSGGRELGKRLAEELGGMPLVDCILEQSHTCYEGTRRERHPWGYGCGRCPACKLRAHGYEVYLSRYHQK